MDQGIEGRVKEGIGIINTKGLLKSHVETYYYRSFLICTYYTCVEYYIYILYMEHYIYYIILYIWTLNGITI